MRCYCASLRHSERHSEKHSGREMKVLGLDIGEKRIGIAVSDALRCTAQGLTVLQRNDEADAIGAIQELVDTLQVSEVVVGLPKNMDGSVGESAQKILLFVSKLEEALSIPIVLWDERWTTAEATRMLLQADVTRKKRRKVVDKIAAVLILQGYLDSLEHHEG
jgi:putative Holliday junction resolvase